MSPVRRRSRTPPMPAPRPPSRSAVCTSVFAARHAGARPNISAQMTPVSSAKPRTTGSMALCSSRGTPGGAAATSTRTPHAASATPAAADTMASTHALGQQLADDPRAAGAERGSDRELLGAGGPARQQQVGDVAARNEQNESDRAQEREEAPGVVANQIRQGRHYREINLRIVFGKRSYRADVRWLSPPPALDRRRCRASACRRSGGSARRASSCARV